MVLTTLTGFKLLPEWSTHFAWLRPLLLVAPVKKISWLAVIVKVAWQPVKKKNTTLMQVNGRKIQQQSCQSVLGERRGQLNHIVKLQQQVSI